MSECADFVIAEQPRNLRNRQFLFSQIAPGKVDPEAFQDPGKSQAFRRQVSRQCSLTYSEAAGDPAGAGFAVRQQWHDFVFNP